MAKMWKEVFENPEFQSLTDEDKEKARGQYFDEVVAPTAKSLGEYDQLRGEFDADTKPKQKVEDDSGRSIGEFAQDTGLDLTKGVVGLGESAVGIADLATGNVVGDAMKEYAGYDPDRTREIISSGFSPSRKKANDAVDQAKGFVPTLKSLAENPSSAIGTIVESAPLMLGSIAAAKALAGQLLSKAGIAAGTPEATAFLSQSGNLAKLTAASSGAEGAMAAGSIQEQSRNQGRAWHQSVLPALAGGAGTATIGYLGSKILPDVDVQLAVQGLGAGERHTLLQAGKEIAKGTFKEGVLEELPQSTQEQIFTNLALGEPWDKDVGKSAATGLVAGSGMGFGMKAGSEAVNQFTGSTPGSNPAPPIPPSPNPMANGIDKKKGPLSRAADTAIKSGAVGQAQAEQAAQAANIDETGLSDDQPFVPAGNDIQTVPEPKADLEAQVSAMVDKKTPKDSVFVGNGSPMPDNIPKDARVIKGASGTLITTNKAKAEEFKINESDEVVAKILGYGKSKNQLDQLIKQGEEPVTLVVKDKNGTPIHEELTTKTSFAEDYFRLDKGYPGQVSGQNSEEVLKNRQSRYQQEQDRAKQEQDKPAGSNAAERPGYILKSNGKPFSTEFTAMQAAKNRGLKDASVIHYEDGFALVREKPENRKPEAIPETTIKQEPVTANLETDLEQKPIDVKLDEPSNNIEQFTPTHELPTGEQVSAVEGEDNAWVDANGDEYIDLGAIPLTAEKPAKAVSQPTGEEIAQMAKEGLSTHPDNDLPTPTKAQIEADNYKKIPVKYDGVNIKIENAAGTKRKPEWPALKHHYGDIKLTEGADGDAIDTFINKDNERTDTPVFIINQEKKGGGFDEHKVMLGFDNLEEAKQGYLDNYSKGWKAPDVIPEYTMAEFKDWLKNGDHKKPATTPKSYQGSDEGSKKSNQFIAYKKWIDDNNGEIPQGMREQINFDNRLYDGESELLLDVKKQSVKDQKQPVADDKTDTKPVVDDESGIEAPQKTPKNIPDKKEPEILPEEITENKLPKDKKPSPDENPRATDIDFDSLPDSNNPETRTELKVGDKWINRLMAYEIKEFKDIEGERIPKVVFQRVAKKDLDEKWQDESGNRQTLTFGEFLRYHHQDLNPETEVTETKVKSKHPIIQGRNELHNTPINTIYQTGRNDDLKYSVRGDGNYGHGDPFFSTEAKAVEERDLQIKRQQAAKEWSENEKKQKEDSDKKEAEYITSFKGFLSDSKMRRGQQLKTLGAPIRSNGKTTTRKELIEDRISQGYTVRTEILNGKPERQLEKDDGYLLEKDITKTGMDYAEHLLQSQPGQTSTGTKKGLSLNNITIQQELTVDGETGKYAINAGVAFKLAQNRLDELVKLRGCVNG